jgi:phenylpropionate dioxygenase-like ring-hydroxylating dioxygenase large terminal subunit
MGGRGLADKNLFFPRSWYPLCRSSDIKSGKVLRQVAFGVPLAIYRTQTGKAVAMTAVCCHMGADLSRGIVLGENLQCPLHHWEFGPKGICENIPAGASIPDRARQVSLNTQERYGLVFVFLGGEPDFSIPAFPEDAEPRISRVTQMEFDTPYQVLASNSYDVQHFASVHHRALIGTPRTFSDSSNHYGIHFNARVEGADFNDRLLRAIGVQQVDLKVDCYGGNMVIAFSERTSNYIMFATLPITATRSRIFVLNAMTAARSRKMPGFLRPLLREITHRLTLDFLYNDIAVVNELQFKFGVLLPDADAGFMGWMRYWNSLPTACLTDRTSKTESSFEANLFTTDIAQMAENTQEVLQTPQ